MSEFQRGAESKLPDGIVNQVRHTKYAKYAWYVWQ